MTSRLAVAARPRHSRTGATIRPNLTELLADVNRLTRTGDRAPYSALLHLLNESPYAALLADTVGVFVFANTAASQLTGYTRNELRGMSFLQLTPNVSEREADILWRAFVERGEQSGKYQVLAKDGRIIATEYAAQTNVVPGLHLSLLQRLACVD